VATEWIINRVPTKTFPAWTRGNAADVFPDPMTPLGWTLVMNASLELGLRDAYIEMGVIDWDEIEDPADPDMFQCFGGYVYNPLSLTRLVGARMPGASPELIDKAFFDERAEVPPYIAEPWHESEIHAARLAKTMEWTLTTDSIPDLDIDKEIADGARVTRPDLTRLYDVALLTRARAMAQYLRQAFRTGMIASSMASLGPGVVAAVCEALGDPTMTIRLLAGVEVDSALPSKAMWELAQMATNTPAVRAEFDQGVEGLAQRLATHRDPAVVDFAARFATFLADYGSRGHNEWDLIAHSWEVDPKGALTAIDLMRRSDQSQSPMSRHDEALAERDRVLADVREKLAGDPETLASFESGLRSSQVFLQGRERYKTSCIKLVGEIRMCFRELARRRVDDGLLEHPDQIFMLKNSELDEYLHEPGRFTSVLATRWKQFGELYEIEPIFAINGSVPPLPEWPRRQDSTALQVAAGTVLHGVAGSGGVATGTARVVLDPSEPGAFEPGDILVAPATDPSWVPLFVAATAVVVAVGAVGSHAMIVSRDLGIPCVVSVEDATTRIPDGGSITVDGTAGSVTVH
jgi:pyruvate,water dikinase